MDESPKPEVTIPSTWWPKIAQDSWMQIWIDFAHQSLVIREPGDGNEQSGEHDDVHGSCSHLEKSSQSKGFEDMTDAKYHSVGEADCWHPPVEGEVGEDWSEGEEEGAKHQTTSPEISTIFDILRFVLNCQLNDQ